MKKIMLFFIIACSASTGTQAQNYPSLVDVYFADNKYYPAKLLEESGNQLKVQFIHSQSIYSFDNTGHIISSTGSYKPGDKVKLIRIFKFTEDLYNVSRTILNGTKLGIVFGDGQLYFGFAAQITASLLHMVMFYHSWSVYDFIKPPSGKWKVYSTDKGKYPINHVIQSVYALEEEGRVFYSDGTLKASQLNERRPSETNN